MKRYFILNRGISPNVEQLHCFAMASDKKPEYYAALPLPCLDFLTRPIQDEDLDKQPGKDPIERKHHVTLHIFLPGPPDEALTKKLKEQKPVCLRLKGTGCFENKSQDVFFVRVEVDDKLLGLHKLLVDEYKKPWPRESYTPHVTLAFLKPGTGKKYLKTIECETISFAMQMEFHQHAGPAKDAKSINVVVKLEGK